MIMNAAIFGAGPCGLTAAWELAKHGISVIVIEKESRVGGLCRTVRRNGFQFDLGGHRFISKDVALIKDIQALMRHELLTRTRKSVIRFHDREYEYPLNLRNVISESSLCMAIQFTAGYIGSLTGISKSPAASNSFEWWADRKFGRPINNFFFKPYTEKLWGIPASTLSDEWAAQRISLLDAKDVIWKLLGVSDTVPRTYASQYLYPKSGIGDIFEKMAEEIKQLGGEVITGAHISRIETNGNNLLKAWIREGQNDERCIKACQYLSTIPIDIMAKLLGDSSAPSLPYRSLRFLNIMLNRENLSPNTWIYVPESDYIMTRIQEPKQRSPLSAPPGKTSVMLEIPCEKGDPTWTMRDNDLLGMVLNDLEKLGFHIANDVTGFFSTRTAYAYPRYEIGYSEKVYKIFTTIGKYENLTTLGRQGLFRYIFMDTAMLMGKRWARSLIKDSRNEYVDEMDT